MRMSMLHPKHSTICHWQAQSNIENTNISILHLKANTLTQMGLKTCNNSVSFQIWNCA